MDAPLLNGEIEEVGVDEAILRLEGEIDISTAGIVLQLFHEAVAREFSRLVIDASGVSFTDSSGLHALVDGKRLVDESGGRMVLVASERLRRLLELAFPEPLFAVRFETVAEALAGLEGDGDESGNG